MWYFLAGCDGSPSGSFPTTDSGTDPVTSETGTTPIEPDDPPVFTAEPHLELPVPTTVRLVQRLLASTDRPTRATLALDDGAERRTIAFPDFAIDHDLSVLGLRADSDYTLTATFVDEAGAAVEATLPLDTGPVSLPTTFDALVADPARMAPGYTVLPVEVGGVATVVAVDAAGEVVWTYAPGVGTIRALSYVDGAFTAMLGEGVARWNAAGAVFDRWYPEGSEVEDAIPIAYDLHHEVAFDDDGSFWTFHKVPYAVADYPTSESDPSVTGPATIDDDHVVHYAADGTLLSEWSMADRLSPERIGFGSLEENSGAYDWAHANAIVPLPGEDAVLVSLRHQDAVVKLSLPDGDLVWILANHDGWPAALRPFLLEPVSTSGGPPFSWQYHQHAPMVGPDGAITLFDNGNEWRTTPYSQTPEPGPLRSRLAQFTVDEAAMTVSLAFEHPGAAYPLYSQALGNADVTPVGTVLGTFAYLHEEDGIDNTALGRGDKVVRVIEVEPASGDVVSDLRVSTAVVEAPTGLLTDRAIRVPSLYPSDVIETWSRR
ncbi:MAG: aryl-sulfate sulfotransferase [Myxococcota bacterium]